MMEANTLREVLLENLTAFERLQPLLIVSGGAVLLLLVGTFSRFGQRYGWMLFGAILLSALMTVNFSGHTLMGGTLQLTPFNGLIQALLITFGLLLVLFREVRQGEVEYQFLLLSVIVGSLLMTMVRDLVVIYLSVELTSLASYALTAFSGRKKGHEAAMKYLLTGAISSAVMIYGISLIFGASGSFLLGEIPAPTGPGLVGWVLLIGGLLFKVSIVPFHLWVPNTYQMAPTSVVGFFTVVPKIGAFVLLRAVLHAANSEPLNHLVIALALITIILGTFSAISQKSLKRLLAYAALAHSGFLLPLVVWPGQALQGAFFFYAAIYALMNLAAFYFVAIHERKGDVLLGDLDGAGSANPLLGGAVVVIMLGLIGLPPTAGFSIKLLLFTEVWGQYQSGESALLITYFIVGVLSSAISLYFYFKVPYHYFLMTNEGKVKRLTLRDQLITTFFAALLLWCFIQPQIFDNIVVTIGKP
ncbi:MAG: NADH-quinone oxidoreductase subunit N [Bacteroidota bacterium]